MIKFLFAILASVMLSGCVTAHYFLNGKKYDNEALFQAAVQDYIDESLSKVQPLPAPLTNKKLIAALPSESAFYAESARRYTEAMGEPLNGIAIEQNTNLSKSNYKMIKVFFEAVQKRGIYSSVEIRDMSNIVIALEPSQEYDVIYLNLGNSIANEQFFYSSVKNGKQVFFYDKSVDPMNGFIEAIQMQAIRD